MHRVGCLFGAVGPTQAWRLSSLLGAAYLRNAGKNSPLLRVGSGNGVVDVRVLRKPGIPGPPTAQGFREGAVLIGRAWG